MRARSEIVKDFLLALREIESMQRKPSVIKINIGKGQTLVLNLEETKKERVFTIIKNASSD